MIAHIFIPIAELVISSGTQTNDVNAQFAIQPAIAENRISKFPT